MSRGVNKVILIGNIGIKNEMASTKTGKVINITLATNVSAKDKETGKPKEVPEWHSITFFDKLAEVINNYADKGSKLYIEGYLKTDQYTDKSGNKAKSTKIVATNVTLLDSKNDKTDSSVVAVEQPPLPKMYDDDIPF